MISISETNQKHIKLPHYNEYMLHFISVVQTNPIRKFLRNHKETIIIKLMQRFMRLLKHQEITNKKNLVVNHTKKQMFEVKNK